MSTRGGPHCEALAVLWALGIVDWLHVCVMPLTEELPMAENEKSPMLCLFKSSRVFEECLQLLFKCFREQEITRLGLTWTEFCTEGEHWAHLR